MQENMKHFLLTSFLFTTFTASAAESPYDKFGSEKNVSKKTTVEWYAIPNVQEVCDANSQELNGHKYGYKVDGCSKWNHSLFSDTCVIYTHLKTDYWTLGHELRHCFQGNFH